MLLCFVNFEGKRRTSFLKFFRKIILKENIYTYTTKNQENELLLFNTKNTDTFIEQTQPKRQETLEFERTKPPETFSFGVPLNSEGIWVIGLSSLEVYNSFFTINDKNDKFKTHGCEEGHPRN